MSLHFRSRASALTAFFACLYGVSLAGALLAGCAPADGRTASSPAGGGGDPTLMAAKIQRIRGWEPTGLKTFHLDLPDGLMSADVDAKAPPKVECKNADGDTRSCSIVLDLGKDNEGAPRTLECAAAWGPIPLPFGILVKTSLGKMGLNEPPRVDVGWAKGSDGGLVARFNANVSYETNDRVLVGTAKLAARYAPGHTLFCSDTAGGAEKTVQRITTQLFDSTKVKGIADGVVIQTAAKERRGQAATGFRFDFVRKGEDGGFTEVKSSFHMKSTDKTWDVNDFAMSVTRDAKGSVEALKELFWVGAQHALVLSAKPGEGGRLRIKLEANGKSDALEMTPQAPLSTELWESPALLRVGSGGAPKHRYAFLAVTDDGEPTLAYSNLTRIRQGIVQEEVEMHGKKVKDAGKQQRNELALDDRGFVVKQVSSDTVDERIHLSGTLPTFVGKKP